MNETTHVEEVEYLSPSVCMFCIWKYYTNYEKISYL